MDKKDIDLHVGTERDRLANMELKYESDPDSVDLYELEHSRALLMRIDEQEWEIIKMQQDIFTIAMNSDVRVGATKQE